MYQNARYAPSQEAVRTFESDIRRAGTGSPDLGVKRLNRFRVEPFNPGIGFQALDEFAVASGRDRRRDAAEEQAIQQEYWAQEDSLSFGQRRMILVELGASEQLAPILDLQTSPPSFFLSEKGEFLFCPICFSSSFFPVFTCRAQSAKTGPSISSNKLAIALKTVPPDSITSLG